MSLTVDIQCGSKLGFAGWVFHSASVVSSVPVARGVYQQHTAFGSSFDGRYAQTAQLLACVETPHYLQGGIPLGHQTRHLRRLPGKYRWLKSEWCDSWQN